jgi:hypothetical protein
MTVVASHTLAAAITLVGPGFELGEPLELRDNDDEAASRSDAEWEPVDGDSDDQVYYMAVAELALDISLAVLGVNAI